MKDQRIKWAKINIISYNGEFMTEEAKSEYKKAYEIWGDCIRRGDFKKANYIIRRLRKKSNYDEG